eukprot:s5934_g2.t1
MVTEVQEQKQSFNDAIRSILDHTASTPDTTQRTHITFYTDGSGSKGRCTAATPAGWGWCAPQGADWLEAYGPVVTSSDHTAYVGATVGSNNTGEVTAIVEALEHEYTHATVHTDSLWARNVILGKWKARTNKALVHTARQLCRRMGVTVHIEWIKAHAGHVGNENRLLRKPWVTDHTLQLLEQAKRAEAAQEDDAKHKRNEYSESWLAYSLSPPTCEVRLAGTNQDAAEVLNELEAAGYVVLSTACHSKEAHDPSKSMLTYTLRKER